MTGQVFQKLPNFTRSTLPRPEPYFDVLIILIEDSGARTMRRSNGFEWLLVGDSGGDGNADWGSISGDIEDQQDLAASFASKKDINDPTIGAMTPAVQSLIDAGVLYARDLTNALNTLSASSLVLASGENMQSYVNRLEVRLGIAGPVNTVQPAAPSAAPSLIVGATLTASTGTWTGASSYKYIWYRVHKTTGVWTATGGTASTYVIDAADYDYRMAYAVVGVAAAPATESLPVNSLVTATAVGSTLASNTVAPSFNVSGNQVSGTTATWNRGTWTNGSTYDVTIRAGGAVVAQVLRTASSTGAYVLLDANVGQVITLDVIAYNAQGVPHSASGLAGSNSITVTGATPALTQVSPPTWVDANIYLETPANLGEATWNHPPDSVIHNFYKNDSPTAFRSGNSGPIFTPHIAPHPDSLVAGDSIVYESIPTYLGVTYPAYRSAAKTVQAVPATLAVVRSAEAAAGYGGWIKGAAIALATIGTISGGTGPFTVGISPALPSTLTIAISGQSIQVTGTPGSVVNNQTYTVTIGDSGGATPVVITFAATVSEPSVTPLPALPYREGSVIVNNGTITQVTDPLGTGRTVDKHRIFNSAYPSDQEVRAEQYWPSTSGPDSMPPGRSFWWSYGVSIDTVETIPNSVQDDELVLKQTHTRGQGNTQPDVTHWAQKQTNSFRINVSYNTRPTAQWSWYGGAFPDTENTTNVHAETMPAPGVRWLYIFHYVPGYLAGHNPLLEVWRSTNGGASYTKIVTWTGYNTYNVSDRGVTWSYLRKGPYKYNGSKWNSAATTLYFTPMYFAEGANLYDRAVAANAGW